jgi:hypothetical protein
MFTCDQDNLEGEELRYQEFCREERRQKEYRAGQQKQEYKKREDTEQKRTWWKENVPNCDVSNDGTAISFDTGSGGGVTCSGGEVWRDYF